MFGGSFNAAKLKPQLKMAVGRIEILKNKKSALLKQSTRQVAQLLADNPPKEEKARIRAEALIRDDNLIEALEIIQLNCDLLYERIKLIQYTKECPIDMISVISTVIWSSHRIDVPELLLIRQQFKYKYGKNFEENAMKNVNGCLNERVVTKLSVEPPAAYLVQVYLEKICEEFDVEWTPSMKLTSVNDMIQPMAAPTGFSIASGQGTGLGSKISLMNVNTGMNNSNNNDRDGSDNSNGGGGGGGMTIMMPPAAPSFHPNNNSASTTVTGYPYQPPQSQSFNYDNNNMNSPSASTITTNFPITPPNQQQQQMNRNNNYSNSQSMKHDDCNEPDIIIPNGATAPPGSVAPTSSTIAATTGTTKPNGSNYDDIVSRFNQLKK